MLHLDLVDHLDLVYCARFVFVNLYHSVRDDSVHRVVLLDLLHDLNALYLDLVHSARLVALYLFRSVRSHSVRHAALLDLLHDLEDLRRPFFEPPF